MTAKKKTTKRKKKPQEYTALRALIVQKEIGAGEYIAKIQMLGKEKVTKEMLIKAIDDIEDDD